MLVEEDGQCVADLGSKDLLEEVCENSRLDSTQLNSTLNPSSTYSSSVQQLPNTFLDTQPQQQQFFQQQQQQHPACVNNQQTIYKNSFCNPGNNFSRSQFHHEGSEKGLHPSPVLNQGSTYYQNFSPLPLPPPPPNSFITPRTQFQGHWRNYPTHQDKNRFSNNGNFNLRARRRVRQRVDAGEPRNSYSSIPGFSFRSSNMFPRPDLCMYKGTMYRGPVYNPHLGYPRFSHLNLVQESHLLAARGGGRAGAGEVWTGDGNGRNGTSSRGFSSETPTDTKINPRPLVEQPSSRTHVHTFSSSLEAVSEKDLSDQGTSETTQTIQSDKNLAENAFLIRDILQSKLAAVSEMMEHSLGGMVLSGPRDFSRPTIPGINNNEFKENTAASIMNHILKVRQEMALNMSKDSDSDRHTESPNHISDSEDKDEPINLQQNGRSSAGSGSDGETSPASPSSEHSAGSAKDQKASRLENIVGGLARSSPLPPQGCKKRKLYQPIQHESMEDDEGREEEREEQDGEEPDLKKRRDGLETQLRTMQDLVKMQHKFISNNDENADPEEKDGELHIDLSREEKRFSHMDEITIEKKINPKSFSGFGHPLLNGSADPLPLPPTSMNANYMDLAKRFLQEQQDKITKDMITKDIVHSTIGRNEIADKLAAISPELEGLADILKSEITTSLTIIVDSIVQRFLTAKRQPLGKFSDDSVNQDKMKTPSGRAPQVRDRATPRTVSNPLSMANPTMFSNTMNTNSQLPISRPSLLSYGADKPLMSSLYNSHLQQSDDEREDEEQDDALNLVVTPKKKRHKVTDTRITPRTVSRLLADQPITSIEQLQKHFNPNHHFVPHGFPKHLADLPRPPFPGLTHSLLPHIPTSLAPDFPFHPFPFHPHLNRPRDLSPPHERARSASPPRDTRPPPPLLHPSMLAVHSPEMNLKGGDERSISRSSSDDLRFDTPGNTGFSLASMSG